MKKQLAKLSIAGSVLAMSVVPPLPAETGLSAIPNSWTRQVTTDFDGWVGRHSRVAMLSAARSVMVWTDTAGTLLARRLDTSGNPLDAADIEVASELVEPISPVVAADGLGGFIVAWQSGDQGVLFRRYDAAGLPVESDPVSPSASAIEAPAVAMNASGSFALAWKADSTQLYVQRFNSDGTAATLETLVTESGTKDSIPIIAMDSEGDFVVGFSKAVTADRKVCDEYGDCTAVPTEVPKGYLKYFKADGSLIKDDFPLDTDLKVSDGNAAVAIDTDGDMVVGWERIAYQEKKHCYTDEEYGRICYTLVVPFKTIRAERFTKTGSPNGKAVTVTAKSKQGFNPAVAMDADGDFLVAWDGVSSKKTKHCYTDEYGEKYCYNTTTIFSDVLAKRFKRTGKVNGKQVRLSSSQALYESAAQVAMNPAGNFVVAWSTDCPNYLDEYGEYGGTTECEATPNLTLKFLKK